MSRSGDDKSMTTRKISLLLLALLFQAHLPAATWYAAPSAGSASDGSVTNPWPLQVALRKAADIKPGDTLYLRGGTYHGAGFLSSLSGTSNNYVTVRSFPGEWAVITDGAPLSLAEDIDANTNRARISGGELLLPGTTVMIGGEMIQIGDNSTATRTVLNRGWGGTTKASHPAGSEPVAVGSLISQAGSYVNFRDFEMTCARATNRIVNGNSGNYVMPGLNLLASGHGNKAVNLIIHNVGHPGIGFWQQGEGGEINGCLIWGVGFYDKEGSWTRGSAIYSQNTTGLAVIKNCINFRNFTSGGKVFGETGPVNDFKFVSNIVFQCSPALEIGSGSTAVSNVWMDGNLMLGTPMLSYVSLSNRNEYFINNVVVNGSFSLKETSDSFLTNNAVFLPKGAGIGQAPIQYRSTQFSRADLKIVWDRNNYYLANGASAYQWAFQTPDTRSAVNSLGGGNLKFSSDMTNSWQDYSTFDANSTYTTNWPMNHLKVSVQSLSYDADRFHISVVNTTPATNATLELATLGFVDGQQWQLRDAQDYFNVISTGKHRGSGTIINLPLTLTNVSSIPGINHYTNKHTNVDAPGLFNAFILLRRSALPQPRNVRIMNPQPIP